MRTSLFVYIACLAVGVTTASAQDYSELLTASFPADATWLITNPSFETGTTDGWVVGHPSGGGDIGAKKNEGAFTRGSSDGGKCS